MEHGPVESINAITLAVAEMPRSVAFYEALGFVRTVGGAGAAFTTFAIGDGFLNLQVDPEHAPLTRIWGRVIFFVDDVDAMHTRALAAGVAPSTAPADAPWGERYFHLHDPDGHEAASPVPSPPRRAGVP